VPNKRSNSLVPDLPHIDAINTIMW